MKEIKDLKDYKVKSSNVLLQGVNESSNLSASSQLRDIYKDMTENTQVCIFTLHGIIEKPSKIAEQELTWLFKVQQRMDNELPEKKRIGKYEKGVDNWANWTKEVSDTFETMPNEFKEKYPKPSTDKNQLFVLGTITKACEGLKVKGVTTFDSNLLLPLNKAMFSDIDGILSPKFEVGQSFEVIVKGTTTKYLQINPSPVVVGKLVSETV